MRYSKNTIPHNSELPPPYTELEMYEMKRKGKRVSKLAKTWLKEIHGEYWNSYLKNK